MATRADRQGRGLGTIALDAALAGAARRGGSVVWCNARLRAIPFYRRAGFAVVSDEFDVPGIGPHRVLARTLGDVGPPTR
jgi:GNAT superfamily N-acetyltransferase